METEHVMGMESYTVAEISYIHEIQCYKVINGFKTFLGKSLPYFGMTNRQVAENIFGLDIYIFL